MLTVWRYILIFNRFNNETLNKMAEILPNGTLQGYSNICPECKKTIQVNMQGTPINHKCEVKNLDIPHVIKSVCRVCKS